MHRIVPELIVENYRAGNYQGSFRAVGMFLDLSGFSTLTDALTKQGQYGAEVLVGLMHNIFDPLVKSIFEHRGKIVGFAGDGIMALFPVEDDDRSAALHALASAWWIQQGLASRSLTQTSYGAFSFSAKVGLSLGEVSWGILRSEGLQSASYYFRGAAVTESTSAEKLARPGDIFLSQSVFEALQNDVLVERGEYFHRLDKITLNLPGATPIILPPVDEEIARVFVPENILVHDERGEFRQAANLFMRFPDLPYETLQDFMRILFELQEQYGGLLSRLDFGDKGCNMLMLWGAPVAYENDIGRTLNFVLDLKSRVDFPITAGITYYIAHAGFLGGVMSECYTCYGWGVNLASRFMMSAPEGSIWIDERIARRIKNRFDYVYLGAQRFKGFETEQKVFSLLGRKSQIDLYHQGEFVGREMEFSRLVNFLQPLWDGKFAGVQIIWGDAGIGKSRLVYELRISGALNKHNVLWAFCHSDQILRHSFNPFRYWLLRFFGISSEMDDDARKHLFRTKLEHLIANLPDPDLAQSLDRARFALGSLLDLYWPNSPFDQLDAEGRYNNILLGLIAFFKAASLLQPIVLFIEDAQFMDEDSKAFLPRLKRSLTSGKPCPIAILISSRRTGAPFLEDEAFADDAMELGALSAQALSNLAEIYLGDKASPDLVRLLQDRSEGNPFFAEQILVFLQEENLLEMSEQGWRALRQLQEASLPADIRALLMARLDQLSSRVRDAIQTASVLGRDFDVSVLGIMMRETSQLLSDLSEAEQAEILTPIGSGRYTFTHGLLRDSAYSMQMRARRRELHALAVEAFERQYATELDHHYGALAYHAERGGLTEKALRYLPLAGHQAKELYQNSQAVDHFSRALALLPDLDQRTRFGILLERVEIYKRIGNRKLQLADIESMNKIAFALADPSLEAHALLHRSHYLFATGDYPHAYEAANRCIELAGPEHLSTFMDAYTLLSSSMLRLGKLDSSMEKALEGLSLARNADIKDTEAYLLNGLGLISIEKNDLLRAMEYLEQSIRIAREISNAVVEIGALNNMGNAAGLLGDYSMARDCYERAYLGVRKRGDRYGEGLVLSNLGWSAGMQGDFAASRAYHQQSLHIAREVGNPYQEAYTLINLSSIFSVQGDAVEGLECARLGREICRKIGERSGEAWADLYMGHAHLLAEELELAQLSYEQCLAIREELHQPNLAAEALAGLVQIALLQNDSDALQMRLSPLLAIMDSDKEFSGAEDPIRVYFTLYQALRKIRDPRAQLALQHAKRLLDAQVSKFKDETERRKYVDNVPWRRAIQQVDLEPDV